MKYPFRVKHDGKYYKSGEDVPTGASSFPLVEENKSPVEEKAPEKVASEKPKKGVEVTKADIAKMSGAKLRAFATENGIDNADDFTNGELKKMLTERLGV